MSSQILTNRRDCSGAGMVCQLEEGIVTVMPLQDSEGHLKATIGLTLAAMPFTLEPLHLV